MGSGQLVIGMDVGSTTVKAVVVEGSTERILFRDYQRHQTKQPEKVLEMLASIAEQFPEHPFTEGQKPWRLLLTGSGSGPLSEPAGGKFVQEVNAVTLAVERLHPDVRSVIELGGQDAKIVVFKQDERTGIRTAIASMNDKCASGTGATIDKCLLKVNASPEHVCQLHFDASKLHHVAAKCGVFAETDIVNLVKAGIPADEILCSLADAIVLQNLSVLTRGNTLHSKVLLLGGPNTFLPFLQECWRLRIPETWNERGYAYPKDVSMEELVFVPDGSQYYAAYGAALYGLSLGDELPAFTGVAGLERYVTHGRKERLGDSAGPPLVHSADEIEQFRRVYSIPRFVPPPLRTGQKVRAVVGLDGGSTSSKAVLLCEDKSILAKAYRLSEGNPIEDARHLLSDLRSRIEEQGATLEVMGFGVTGYAGDILQETMLADVNIVETVAHMVSAVHFFGDVDVICDIGGQDIKVLFLKNGDIANFRLSNSCSAGNGMLLQAMADQFGLPVTQYAETAFRAELAPKFSYGCAVFLDSDRVNFQKEGYSKEELLAGLAQVLPKNVWQYVVQIPRLASLGRRFVLQGGTQYNLAALKAQVDYIHERVPDAEVYVHPHTGEAGAIGAALETLRVLGRGESSRFIGIDPAISLAYTTKNDESTVCHFCPNECKRTFVDAKRPDGRTSRYIAGFSCEKGTVESKEAMLRVVEERKSIASRYPNLPDYEAKVAFLHQYEPEPMPNAGTPIDDVDVRRGFFSLRRVPIKRSFVRSPDSSWAARKSVRVGIPRVLNMYSTAPWFRAYFESLGVPKQNIVFSDATSEDLWVRGGKYGSIDPCYPSKVVQAHVHDLLFSHHGAKRPLSYLFFPILTHVPSFVADTMSNTSCPIVAGTPEVIKAAFTKETDFFAQRKIEYLDPALSFSEPKLLARRMYETFAPRLGISEDENDFACAQGWKALDAFDRDLQEKGRAILETVERENRVAILLLARPYHSDPGLNHGIPEEFQVLGYPILSIRSIPKDRAFLDRFFREELERGTIKTPLALSHLWPENYSANSAQKVWAASFAAHHPNVVVLDLSSFKCGHDAPTYGLIDSVVATAKTPYAALHDLDANKPGGSIKIRVKTYAHSLKLHEERLRDLSQRREMLERSIAEKRRALVELRAEERAAEERAARGLSERDRANRTGLEEQLRAYGALHRDHAAAQRPRDLPAGVVQLGRKTADGRVIRIPNGHPDLSLASEVLSRTSLPSGGEPPDLAAHDLASASP